MKFKKIIVGLFIVLITIPLLFTSIYKVTDIKLDTSLQGNFDTVNKPEYSVSNWFSGELQNEFVAYLNNNYVSKGWMQKTYNQLRYSLFSEGDWIVGNNGSIFGDYWISDALILGDVYNYSLPENQTKMQEYVAQLESIHEKLQKVDKQLIVYTTPSKGVFNMDEIPQRYLKEKKEAQRAIDVFNQYISETNVVYFNSTEYLLQYTDEEWPVFYKTGIHWSRPAEQLVCKELLELIKHTQEGSTKTISIEQLAVSETPYWRDMDVYSLLNIWNGETDKLYYEFNTQTVIPENYKEYTVLAQGGSFGEGLKKQYLDSGIGYQFYDIFYNQALRDSNWNATAFNDWSELPFQELLDETDIIIIEISEAGLASYSDGYVAYLSQFLNTYSPI